jgi:hypothetical protein
MYLISSSLDMDITLEPLLLAEFDERLDLLTGTYG